MNIDSDGHAWWSDFWSGVKAKGYGEDGQFTPFQKVMGVIASIGGVGMLAGAALSVSGASVIGVPLFAISAVVVILSAILGGFGGQHKMFYWR